MILKVLAECRVKMGELYDARYDEVKHFTKDIYLAVGAKTHLALDANLAGIMGGLIV